MFEKCLRGDPGDNVMSAYPRLRATRIQKAYDDEAERINLLNEEIELIDGRKVQVKVLFEENKMLMDLECQPEELRATMYEKIAEEVNYSGAYSSFHFMKFLGKYKMERIAEELHQFMPIFNANADKVKRDQLLID
jgi:hypothetical protein